MAAMTSQQLDDAATLAAILLYGNSQGTATVDWGDLRAGVVVIDDTMEALVSTLTQDQSMIININSALPAPVSGLNPGQKALLNKAWSDLKFV